MQKKFFLKEEDVKIIDDICFTLKKDNRLPFSWTHQENFYLNNCENFKSKIEYLVYRYKFKVYPEKISFKFSDTCSDRTSKYM